jgi:hypothetical protein
MNERISELVNQALVGKETYFLSYVPENFFNDFAGLIVKECIESVRNAPGLTIGQGYSAIVEIKRHFGVEE